MMEKNFYCACGNRKPENKAVCGQCHKREKAFRKFNSRRFARFGGKTVGEIMFKESV